MLQLDSQKLIQRQHKLQRHRGRGDRVSLLKVSGSSPAGGRERELTEKVSVVFLLKAASLEDYKPGFNKSES